LPTITSEPREMLTAAEKQHLFETAASKPEWQTAYCAALLTANTSMRPKELMRLLWSDLDPFSRLITVRRSKTEAGKRVIPLNDEAWSAIAAMKKRDDALGAYAPEHYIFCRQRPQINPTRPMSGWRSAWRSLRKAAGMPKFRYYDLRHQCITEMLEAGIPEGVIREVAGHVDPAMTKHYSHPRLAARRAAVEALATVMGNVETGRGPDMPPGPQRALNGLLPTRLNKNPSTRYGLLSRWNKSPSTQQTVLGPLCQR